MNKLSLLKHLGLVLGCAALLLTSHAASAGEIRANAGTTFTLEPTDDAAVFKHTVDGIAQVSPIGNCKVHFDVVAQFPADPTQPIALSGSLSITSADGLTTLKGTVAGAVSGDPENPQEFANFHYRVRFTGGTGEFEGARGAGVIKGAALWTSQSTGKATWTMKGYVAEMGK
jgi:hypothetical protein